MGIGRRLTARHGRALVPRYMPPPHVRYGGDMDALQMLDASAARDLLGRDEVAARLGVKGPASLPRSLPQPVGHTRSRTGVLQPHWTPEAIDAYIATRPERRKRPGRSGPRRAVSPPPVAAPADHRDDETLTTAQVAALLGISPTSVRVYRHRGTLPEPAHEDGWSYGQIADLLARRTVSQRVR